MADSDETTRPRKAGASRKTSTTKAAASTSGASRPERARTSQPAHDSSERSRPVKKGLEIAREGARQLQQLTGNQVEGITGMSRTDDGWRVQVDVLELRRVPNTTDVLATYDVEVDAEGELTGYHRRARYVRGEVSEGR